MAAAGLRPRVPVQARNLLAQLEYMLKSFFHQDDFYKMLSHQNKSYVMDEAEAAALRGWVDWVVDYCHFFLTNSLRLFPEALRDACLVHHSSGRPGSVADLLGACSAAADAALSP